MAGEKPIDRIVDQIVAALETGVRPWRKPWDARSCGEVHLPLRADGQPFGGMNAITLLMAGAAGGYAAEWLDVLYQFQWHLLPSQVVNALVKNLSNLAIQSLELRILM